MRIAHVTDCYLPRMGGIELHVRDLASRQRAAGHDVTVVTSVAAGSATGAADGIAVVRPATRRGRGAAIHYSRSWSGRANALAGQHDVIHVHTSAFSPLAFLTAAEASRAGIPTAVTVHSLWSSATPLFAAVDRLWGWGDWPIAWSAVSTVAAQPLRRVLRGRADVAVVPNGIDPAQWLPVVAAKRHSDRVRMVAVMRLARRKRPLRLLAMLRQVARIVGPDTRLSAEIIGDGPQRDVVERYLERHRMNAWVRLAGWRTREQIRAAHARSDIFVSPARLESFGIAALEARCAGLPVVARLGTGIEEFVAHRRGGILVGSDDDMVAALVELIETPALRRAMSAHNMAAGWALTWDDVLARCSALYRVAAAAQSGRGHHSEPEVPVGAPQ